MPDAASLAPVVTIGGTGVMVLGALAGGLVCIAVAIVLARRLGWVSAVAVTGFWWSVLVIGLVTLMPAQWDPGIVPAETRQPTCSTDYGGPAPDGFWIFAGTQRLLNTALFVPSGALLVLAAARWKTGLVLVPLGIAALAAFSVAIEFTQLALARIDRACDITDMVDNVSGVLIGALIGLALAAVLRPWRRD